jgi:NADH-quinone oxidoreductase subunit F
MPAWVEEIDAATDEGITLRTLTNPKEILATDGKVSGMNCATMKLGAFDSSGRRRPVESDEQFQLEADQVIVATGQTLDCEAISGGYKLTGEKASQIAADSQTGQTSVSWIFAGGDSVSGPASVIEAVASGETSAIGIHQYLSGDTDEVFWRDEKAVDTFFDPDADPVIYPRVPQRMLEADRRKHNFDEVELVWSEGEAVRQAKRCLRCDYGKC